MGVDQTQLLLEYLKEQYTQARQHETRETAATAFLTAASGVVLGIAFSGGQLKSWWFGLIVFGLGLTNYWINEQHFKGNRFHTTLAGKTRRALEDAIKDWTVSKPTELRSAALKKYSLQGPNKSMGEIVHKALRIVPFGVMIVGTIVVVAGLCSWIAPLRP